MGWLKSRHKSKRQEGAGIHRILRTPRAPITPKAQFHFTMKWNPTRAVAMAMALVLIIPIMPVIPQSQVSATAPTIGGFGSTQISFNEGSENSVLIAPNVTISDATSYSNGSLQFSIENSNNKETISLSSAEDPTSSGAISLDGTSVYLGTGNGNKVRIGGIDSTANGQNGNPLKINITFTRTFTNPSFEDGWTGWTSSQSLWANQGSLNNTSIPIRSDESCGCSSATIYVVNPSYSSFTISRESNNVPNGVPNGSNVVSLSSTGSVPGTSPTCCSGAYSIFGPSIMSDAFTAYTGDQFSVKWQAMQGDDWYDVFGYLLSAGTDSNWGTADDTRTVMFSERGSVTSWKTSSVTIPSDNQYKFEFVSGSYDASGGTALGATLYIDYIQLLAGTTVEVSAAVMQSILKQITYHNTDKDPASNTNKSVTLTVTNGSDQSSTASATLSITNLYDHAPELTAMAANPNYKKAV